MLTPDSSERILLVEGPDDDNVVWQLCEQRLSAHPFSIKQKQGINQLLEAIPPEVKVPGRKSIGILVDANDDLSARWQAITDRLQKANVSVPINPDPLGTMIQGNPRVGIWLMPDNVSPGEIEDFIEAMIPVSDAVWPLASKYIERIPSGDRKFKPGKKLRAKVHAWLATREKPRRMGSAIGAGDLDLTATITQDFATWLKALFV